MTTTHSDHPLVSCLCVSWKRAAKLERALRGFLGQSYPNRELVIVHQDDDPETRALVSEYTKAYGGSSGGGTSGPTIRGVEVQSSPRLKLGELRNVSLDACRGEYFCQWDDDDWNHPDRIATLLAAVRDNFQTASILTNILVFDSRDRRAYVSLFRLWEGTLLCRRDAIDEGLRYPGRGVAEDSLFLNRLVARSGIYPVVAPGLYIYDIHQQNSWPREHHELLFSQSLPLSPSASALVDDILNEKYSLDEAAERLSAPAFLKEVKYFTPRNINYPDEDVVGHVRSMHGADDV
jgi:glycosyltransferase involved in cell wall biosynthesis